MLLLIAAMACTTTPDTFELIEGSGDHQPSGKIYGGSAATDAHHAAVVSLHQRSGSSVYTNIFCSGTLIADDVVLTAAHCLDTARRGKRYSTMSPSDLAIYVGDNPTVDMSSSNIYAVSETLIHPSYDRNALTDDIALVRLSSPVPGAVTVDALPASLGLTSADIGVDGNFVGFGKTEYGTYDQKLQVDVPIGGLGCSVAYCPSSGDSATQVSYSQTAGGGPCSGDSGGPMFITRSGVQYVAGVTSYGDSYCQYYGVSTRPDAYESWISSFVGTTSDTGTSDTGTTDTGTSDTGSTDTGTSDTGTGSSDCGDGVCGTGESCDGRSGTDACASDCDGKLNGKPSLRYCYVEGTCEGAGCP